MGNKPIEKMSFDGKFLKNAIYRQHYSLRSFAKKIGISDRTLRQYIKTNLIPIKLKDTINNALSNKFVISAVRKFPEYVYVVRCITEGGRGRRWSEKAFKTASAAFAHIQKIIAYERPDVEWTYKDHEYSSITIEGNGKFEFTNSKDNQYVADGTMTIKYERIMLDRD